MGTKNLCVTAMVTENIREENGRRSRNCIGYEEAFVKTGHGTWQYILLAVCGWANASDAIEILCISFILPHIKRDMNVSYASLSGLTFALFFGMAIGGYLWGTLADRYGRRKTLSMSLAFNAVFGIVSGMSPNYASLMTFRFLSGVGAGGSLPVCFTYFGEFQQAKKRGAMICGLAMCWMLGNLLSALLAWCLLPDSEYVASLSPLSQQWRLFTLLCGFPSLSSSILILYLPESPKFLYTSGKTVQSLNVLTKIFLWNHRKLHQTDFGIDRLTHPNPSEDIENASYSLLNSSDSEENSRSAGITLVRRQQHSLHNTKWWHSWKAQMLQIFAPVRRIHSAAIMIISVSVAFGGYGMAMWMPVLMDKAEKYNGSPCQTHPMNTSNSTFHGGSSSAYVDILIGFIGQLPGNVVVILLMDRIGAKVMLIYSAYLSALSVFLFWFINSKAAVIAMNAIFNAISVGCWDALDVLLVETYPTSIRSAATGNAAGISRIGSMLGTAVFGVFMDSSCSIPIITVFAAYTVVGFVAFKLPNHRGANLV